MGNDVEAMVVAVGVVAGVFRAQAEGVRRRGTRPLLLLEPKEQSGARERTILL
jgi:hypothetical protein